MVFITHHKAVRALSYPFRFFPPSWTYQQGLEAVILTYRYEMKTFLVLVSLARNINCVYETHTLVAASIFATHSMCTRNIRCEDL